MNEKASVKKAKAKIDLNRVAMPKQRAESRRQNFSEVATGYTADDATREASRCIECKARNCVAGCPVAIDIPQFVSAVKTGDFATADKIIKQTNALPGICGRVCPQESQCEAVCSLAKKKAPVAIGRLERFVADWELSHRTDAPTTIAPSSNGKKVAVIGSGPSGLTCAAELARLGHAVTIFESLHVAGGVLMYGIPEFRLPKSIVQTEIEYVKSLGVEIVLNAVVGKTFTIDELFEDGFRAVFLGTGAGLPLFLNIENENAPGVYSANEFLSRVNLMKAYRFPEFDTPLKVGNEVAVIGGGNVAMDAARCAVRLGAKVTVVYRRSREEMPARLEEVENAEEEGINFLFLTNPVSFQVDERKWVSGMTCQKMTLGEPDASGRRRPVPIDGSEFNLPVDMVVVALGTRPNPLIARSAPDLAFASKGTVIADESTGLTRKSAVWAGGDIVTGSATVISAMGAGKAAARDIDRYLASL
ncbi:NADPH-dependent glutamate synthase [Dehalogenimonas etheniformans]|uniref:Glutamate synthase (NADPH), homotetrameric n=1 Tax=Dehalogenimonas etheniformans TaxID=1536648 RepID=A0A2P5P772_9CHLR|nr:NADPH-dependent glutamate synthase [Dehalogenimonas etheniformans]PPD58156.1 glutamate synthase (NADPH), homotetrameric [Dehalogenimonas etheniformans]QNT75565.1 NADPH-dependent glutamate synthase [Dehalogenimonas etheniformans]